MSLGDKENKEFSENENGIIQNNQIFYQNTNLNFPESTGCLELCKCFCSE